MKKRLLLLSLALLACLALSAPAWAANVANESALRTALQGASTNPSAPTEITLTADIQTTNYLEVKSGTYVTLDLNGHTIDRGLAGKDAVKNGFVIGVQGSLTLKDSRSGGKITGGNNTGSGGGVLDDDTYTFFYNLGYEWVNIYASTELNIPISTTLINQNYPNCSVGKADSFSDIPHSFPSNFPNCLYHQIEDDLFSALISRDLPTARWPP